MGSLVLSWERYRASKGAGGGTLAAVPEDTRHASVYVAFLQKAPPPQLRLRHHRARCSWHCRQLHTANCSYLDKTLSLLAPVLGPVVDLKQPIRHDIPRILALHQATPYLPHLIKTGGVTEESA